MRSLKLALTTRYVPTADVERQTADLHQASCLICGKEGPNDVYTTRKVTGMILAVHWATERHVCCAVCARNRPGK